MTLEGQIMGDFRVLQELGRGGMGIVYLAEQESLRRQVALKVLPRSSTLSADMLIRFRREAESASKLDHPGICAIYATGVHDEIPWIAMRHVEGQTLSRLLQERRRTESKKSGSSSPDSTTFRFEFNAPTGTSQAASNGEFEGEAEAGVVEETTTTTSREDVRWSVAFIEEAARALHHAHEARVMHRDIKPGNIMVTPDHQPVILDFGLARHLDGTDERSLTQSGDLMGTPHYMSPEQISGHGLIDARTDVYSLGVTLYEMLAGRRPFEAPNRERLYRAILTDDPIQASKRNPLVERDLEIVVSTAMERDLNLRYQSAAAFADDLHAILKHEPISARSLGPVLRLRKWVRRNPAATVALLAAFALLVFGIFDWRRVKHERELIALEKERTDEQRKLAERQLNRARALQRAAQAQSLAASEPALALHLALEAASIERGPEVDRALRVALGATPEERLFMAPAVREASIDDRSLRARGAGARARAVEKAGPRGRLPVFQRRAALALSGTSDPASDRIRDQMAPTGDVFFGDDPKDDRVLTLSDDQGGVPAVFDLASGSLVAVLGGHKGRVNSARFSPDGKSVVTAGKDATARVFEVETGKQTRVLRPREGGMFQGDQELDLATFHPLGDWILATSSGRAHIWSTELPPSPSRPGPLAGEPPAATLDRYRVGDGPPLAVFHPIFPWVASAASNCILVWQTESSSPSKILILDSSNSDADIRAISFAPKTARVATADRDGWLSLWDLPQPPWEGQTVAEATMALRAHEGEIRSLAFDGTGETLAIGTSDGRVIVYDIGSFGDGLREPKRRWAVNDHAGPVLGIVFSEDGARLVTSGVDRTARVFLARNGAREHVLRGHPDWVVASRFDPRLPRVLTFAIDGTMRLFATNAASEDAVISLPREVQSVEWSPDAASLTCVCRDGSVQVVDPARAWAPAQVAVPAGFTARAARYGVPGEGLVLSGSGDAGFVRALVPGRDDFTWSIGGSLPRTAPIPRAADRQGLALCRDRRHLLAIDPFGVPFIAAGGRRTANYEALKARRHAIAASPDSEEFVVWADGKDAWVVSPESAEPASVLPAPSGVPHGASFSSDAAFVLLENEDGRAFFVRRDDRQVVARFDELAIAPHWLAERSGFVLARRGAYLEIHDSPASGAQWSLPILADSVTRLAVDREGRRLLVFTAEDLSVWDLKTHLQLAEHRVGSAAVLDLDISVDSTQAPVRVALGLADKTLRILSLDPERLARRRQVRSLTAEEIRRFDLPMTPEIEAALREEAAMHRRIELDTLWARANYGVDPANLLAYARRILDREDPVAENYPQALLAANIAVERTKKLNAEAHHVRARAFAANQQVKEAIAAANDALAVVKDDADLRSAIETDLALWRAASP